MSEAQLEEARFEGVDLDSPAGGAVTPVQPWEGFPERAGRRIGLT